MTMRYLILFLVVLSWGCSGTPREGIYHTVGKGETLYRISRTYGVDERYLARLNGVPDPSRLEVGQLIYVPSATRELRMSPAAPAPRSIPSPAPSSLGRQVVPEPPPRIKPSPPAPPPKNAASRPPPPAPSVPPVKSSRSAPVGKGDRGTFEWPVRGSILKSFGKNGLQSCQGVEIAAPAGTPVRSAREGTVTYSGSGIRGYGNLIILKHQDSYFTVYAFNQKNLVKAGARVGKGDKIALSGIPPGGGEPALHFEIRQGKTAVNPIFYLP